MKTRQYFYVTLIRRLAELAVVIASLIPASAYFTVEYTSSSQRLEHDVKVQARVATKLVTEYPEGWRDAVDRLSALLQEVRDVESRTMVSTKDGERLVTLGKEEARWRIHRQAPFHDFGVEVGMVEVSVSLEHIVGKSLLLVLAGLVCGLVVLTLMHRGIFRRLDMANAEMRIAAAAFDTQEGILVTNARQEILRVNKAFTRITGYPESEVVGKTPAILSSGRHDAQFYREMQAQLADKGFWQGEIWNRRKNGEHYPEWLTITTLRDEDGAVAYYVGSISDITERVEARAKIQNLAYYDTLTGLPNRRLLMDRLQKGIAASKRSSTCNAVLFIDLDGFKAINDTKGHAAGDTVLREVAKRVQTCVREEDTIARLGGDEFVVLLDESQILDEGAAGNKAEHVAHRILAAIGEPIELPSLSYRASASIGISLLDAQTQGADELLKRADAAMYQAKQAGRSTVRFFDPAMQAALEARLVLENDLRQAIDEKDQFRLYYQIQMDRRGTPVGAEALLRWQHPVRGMVSPLEFIPLAESSGLILPIGHWVLETACAQLRRWQDHALTRDLQIAVNVSAEQFAQEDFVNQVYQVLQQTGAPPTRLKLELTESMVVKGIEQVILKMNEIKALGVRFSVDDFGTGHSSLSYLTRLPFDQIKIDQSFVQNSSHKPADATMVRAIISMGQNLGMDVIAEGVETPAQRDFLIRNGCSAFQGYLFGKPVPLEEFESSLAASSG